MNVVILETVGRSVPVNEQSSYEGGSRSVFERKKEDEEKRLGECFLTHSLKEELEEVKESLVFSVRPEQRMP